MTCTCDGAGRAFDPTGTGAIRRAWSLDARVRARQTEKRIKYLIQASEGVNVSPGVVASVAMRHMATDRYWARYVLSAYRKGMDAASKRLALPRQQLSGDAFVELERLVSRTGDEMSAIANDAAHRIADGVASATNLKDMLSRAVISDHRSNLVVNVETVAACAYGTLRVYKDNGIQRVGIIPEGTTPITKDAFHSRRGPGGRFASMEARLAAWETMQDKKVCPNCAKLEGKIFDMDESEDMIPLHPNCRCAWAPL